jgi:DNA repair protein RadC
VLAFKVCAFAVAKAGGLTVVRPSDEPVTACAATWCSGLGQSRPIQIWSSIMLSSLSTVAQTSTLMVCDEGGAYRPATADEVLRGARTVLSRRVRRGVTFDSPKVVREFLTVQLGALDHEVFCVAFVDAQHRLLAFREMFRGTLTQTSVYPREIIKEALAHNCAAVVLAHNHPSGSVEASRADEYLTQTLKQSLALVDVRVLDHVIVAGPDTMCFSERGLL